MKLSFNNGSRQKIEPSNSPMVVTQPNQPQADGFFFPMPTGTNNGDIAYWNPNAGSSGAWVKLDAPSNGGGASSKNVLSHSNGLEWFDIDLESILGRLDALETKVDTLGTEVDALVSQVSALVSQVSALVSQVSALVSQVTILGSEITTLATDVDAIEQRLNSASINAQCENGTVTVTLNL